jgi:hypothetical protein
VTAGGGAAVTGGGAGVVVGAEGAVGEEGVDVVGGGTFEVGGDTDPTVPAGTAAATVSSGLDPPQAGIASTQNNATLGRIITSHPAWTATAREKITCSTAIPITRWRSCKSMSRSGAIGHDPVFPPAGREGQREGAVAFVTGSGARPPEAGSTN